VHVLGLHRLDLLDDLGEAAVVVGHKAGRAWLSLRGRVRVDRDEDGLLVGRLHVRVAAAGGLGDEAVVGHVVLARHVLRDGEVDDAHVRLGGQRLEAGRHEARELLGLAERALERERLGRQRALDLRLFGVSLLAAQHVEVAERRERREEGVPVANAQAWTHVRHVGREDAAEGELRVAALEDERHANERASDDHGELHFIDLVGS